jgi:hypothetical protein
MISRLLLPSRVRLELRTPACEYLGASEPGRSCTARCSGLPVAPSVEAVPDHLAGGGFDGSDPAQTREGGLATQPLWVVFKATIKRVAAFSVPMPAKEINSGAACATSRSRCASRSAISSESASWRRATERSANYLVAAGTSQGSSPRRKRAATLTSSFVESPRKRWRSCSGAVTRKACSWLAAFRSST